MRIILLFALMLFTSNLIGQRIKFVQIQKCPPGHIAVAGVDSTLGCQDISTIITDHPQYTYTLDTVYVNQDSTQFVFDIDSAGVNIFSGEWWNTDTWASSETFPNQCNLDSTTIRNPDGTIQSIHNDTRNCPGTGFGAWTGAYPSYNFIAGDTANPWDSVHITFPGDPSLTFPGPNLVFISSKGLGVDDITELTFFYECCEWTTFVAPPSIPDIDLGDFYEYISITGDTIFTTHVGSSGDSTTVFRCIDGYIGVSINGDTLYQKNTDCSIDSIVLKDCDLPEALNFGRFSSVTSLNAAASLISGHPLFGDEGIVFDYPIGSETLEDAFLQFDGVNWVRIQKSEFNPITQADRYDLTQTELNAIPIIDLLDGDKITITNFLNDEVDYVWDGAGWCRKTQWHIKCTVVMDTDGSVTGTPGTFYILDDAGHDPVGLVPSTGIINNGPTDIGGFNLIYPHINTNRRTFQITSDEDFTSKRFQTGNSTSGTNTAVSLISYQGYGGLIRRLGSGWVLSSNSSHIYENADYMFTWDDTDPLQPFLRIDFPDPLVSTSGHISLTKRGASTSTSLNLRPVIKDSSTNFMEVYFINTTGGIVTSETTAMQFNFIRHGTTRPDNIKFGGGNLWIDATFDPGCY